MASAASAICSTSYATVSAARLIRSVKGLVTGPNPRALGVDADADDLDGVIVEEHAVSTYARTEGRVR